MTTDPTDSELLRRYALTHDEAAFGEVVRRHMDFVYGCALRRVGGDAHLAQDVTQQVFCDVARRAHKLARHAVFGAWLHTSTRYAASHVVRGERRRKSREAVAFMMNTTEGEASRPADWERIRPVLDDTIDQLDQRDREAVVLRFFEGRSFAQVGAQLRVTENAARMRVDRALDKLHGLLARRGIRSTTAALGAALSGHAAAVAPARLAGAVTAAALATGATTGAGTAGASGWATFMSMTKLQVGLSGALAVAGAVGFAVQAETVSALRGTAAELRRENATLRSLEAENRRLARLAAEVGELRRDDAEFARLQEEAGGLRARLEQIARVEQARAAAAAASIQPFDISQLDRSPRPKFQRRPNYPAELRNAGVRGEVVVDFVVDSSGAVQKAFALRSSHREFEAPAVEAVADWRFEPGRKGGRDVSTHMQVPIVFTSAAKSAASVPSAPAVEPAQTETTPAANSAVQLTPFTIRAN